MRNLRIIRNIAVGMLAVAFLFLAIVVVLNNDETRLASPLPQCAVEDASYGPTPCRWEAATQGNGLGTSVTVANDDAALQWRTVDVAYDGVSQDTYAECAYYDGWGEPECVIASARIGTESLVETMSRLGY